MKPAIIFVHGLGLTGDIWALQQEWCRKYSVESVALTLPGHGLRRDDIVSVETMVGEVVTTAHRFKEVVLVGHSFGAFICGLAVPKIRNIETIILINPLLDAAQIKWPFLVLVKMTKAIQQFFGVSRYSGDFAKGSRWFWRWGIYPYCLVRNRMDSIEKLHHEIKGLRRVPLLNPASYTLLWSQNDELLKPVAHKKSITIPFSGHMLFRLAPEEVNRFLAQAVLSQKEHHS